MTTPPIEPVMQAMSTCNKCGRQFPSAPQGVIHKCQCSGGMMVPNVSAPAPRQHRELAESFSPQQIHAVAQAIAGHLTDFVMEPVTDRDMGLAHAALSALRQAPDTARIAGQFKLGDRVTKIKGSKWSGRVVGFYSTDLTPEGYAVESETETGSVQIYPASALANKAPNVSQEGER
jgi:dihydrofolate reductase (trimethoprim resistance protein)